MYFLHSCILIFAVKGYNPQSSVIKNRSERMDKKLNNFSESIINEVGNTPLIKLKKASEITGCNILGKAEFLNPGQSIKDRAALFMIKEIDKKATYNNTIVENRRKYWNRSHYYRGSNGL